ncbi:hypothetical protein ACWEWG_30830 [Streptomyces sp. NPDC003758]|uniref:DUF2867 domain-containing protein n=1 Tax=Streptomyces cynarae TaxID=2981134 RepID=A0ABY6E9F0_9ACTN|nr:hypothetical protein [Streptomyces cynarae]UXY22832.1 hypothetical protein N8I84_32105 [Streptomyces cynarae]
MVALTESDLLDAGDDRLVEVFGASPAGDIPKGPLQGTGIVRWGGGWLARPLAWLVRMAVWRGKVFVSEGYLSNRMTPFDVLAVVAQVYKGPSLMDEQECIVIDYSRMSLVARGVRDEMRQVGQGLYLGVVWLFGLRVGWFALRVPEVDRTLPGAGGAAAG